MNALETRPVRIIGVPMDLGASRRGTDMGPSALRVAGLGRALRGLGYEVLREADITVPAMETRDAGETNARFKAEILAVCQQLSESVAASLAAGERPLVIGGDHSVAMGTVSGVAAHVRQQNEPLGLVWFDAHGDMNLPETSPSGNIHGMPLAHLLGRGDPGPCKYSRLFAEARSRQGGASRNTRHRSGRGESHPRFRNPHVYHARHRRARYGQGR